MTLAEYLSENNIATEETSSGLKYTLSKTNGAEKAKKGNTVSVHYTGKLLDGTVFDSSRNRGPALDFTLGVGQVISGWDEGIALLGKGDQGTLYIPSELAYGRSGAGGVIPPNADLIFEVELVDFK